MKFIEAIKALVPGQLLVSPYGGKYEVSNGFITGEGSESICRWMDYLHEDGWQVIDKPRPRVKFADAIAAASKGATIKSLHTICKYKVVNGVPKIDDIGLFRGFNIDELCGDWEIIEAEGGK